MLVNNKRIGDIENTFEVRSIEHSFNSKIELFMETHVLPLFNPQNILWWFSVSGGKDSYAMVNGIKKWYEKQQICFDAVIFHINQWGGHVSDTIGDLFDEYDVRIIDGRALTSLATQYKYGKQAPCRQCANVRRHLNDKLILSESHFRDKINFIARGLHLSDIATSLFWRYTLYDNPLEVMRNSKKGNPIVRLWQNTFLAKPLSYVREFESQQYSVSLGFKPSCCGCPACHFPSRRDIVEESLLQFKRTPLWEFSIPCMRDLLCYWSNSQTAIRAEHLSSPGLELKKPHLPEDYGLFAVEYFREKIERIQCGLSLFDHALDLDKIGTKRIQQHYSFLDPKKMPLPAILNPNRQLSNLETLMIGTMGPLWGAIGLMPHISQQAFLLQQKLFGFTIDENWSQVTKLLNKYYGGDCFEKLQFKKHYDCDVGSSLNNYLCNY